ncbi:MAGUK p55 subfamily member 7 [Neolamprologus brichardi]|uniref:MAGUK p55 subfamily member 7 n=1 Tax=Neolamprologus brichardi TaxID=32507 RepID=UPI0016439900|nr:MAGUK p55 subfamily member 7 [Neolamprologus brichardi]
MPALATGTGHEPGLYELLAALPSQLQPHVNCSEDNTFLQDMFGERSLHSLVKIHERLQHYEESKPAPVLEGAAPLARDNNYINLFKDKCGACDFTGAIGLIHVGDELKEVNGIPVDDKKPEEIIRILAQSQGAITFKVVPAVKEEASIKEPQMFVKALFDYNPKDDNTIPCKEAGLPFKKGCILQIMSQDDATWWQAKHEGDTNPRAGLIPSKQFQERRLAFQQPVTTLSSLRRSTRRSSGFRRSFRLSRRDRKTTKSMYEAKKSEMYDMADVPTYEEVVPYRRQRGDKHRLVVLVGPTGVGLSELKKKLLISDPQHFSVTIPRPTGVGLSELKKKLLISDPQHFSVTIPQPRQSDSDPYRKRMAQVLALIERKESRKVSRLALFEYSFQLIKHLRTAEFKPFVVFVKPPTVDRLRETRKKTQIISGKDDKDSTKPFTEEDFQEMVNTAQIMETQYSHLFEMVIVNDDLDVAFSELQLALKKVETETHWIPVSWTHS